MRQSVNDTIVHLKLDKSRELVTVKSRSNGFQRTNNFFSVVGGILLKAGPLERGSTVVGSFNIFKSFQY